MPERWAVAKHKSLRETVADDPDCFYVLHILFGLRYQILLSLPSLFFAVLKEWHRKGDSPVRCR
jgi:hypothetical protein